MPNHSLGLIYLNQKAVELICYFDSMPYQSSIFLYVIFYHLINELPVVYFTMCVNSSPPGVEYMCQWIRSALVQIMVGCLFGTKPLSKPMLGYCQLDLKEQTSVTLLPKYKNFHSQKLNFVCKKAAILFRGRWVKWSLAKPPLNFNGSYLNLG